MITIVKTDYTNPNFVNLVAELDADLAIRDGDDHPFYNQFNKIDAIQHVLLAFENDKAIGCGCIKPYDDNCIEVKRMFVLPSYRNKGIASVILSQLENWTVQLGTNQCILETGILQHEAIGFYKKNGYQIIENYGQYAGVKNSICFLKKVGDVNNKNL